MYNHHPPPPPAFGYIFYPWDYFKTVLYFKFSIYLQNAVYFMVIKKIQTSFRGGKLKGYHFNILRE